MKKTIALYLPQYHRIPENDQWWGEGFTDWNNVKNAYPLFKGHQQPVIPMDGFYDLQDPKTLEKQSELALKYGIDGFCYYHYWFNGKLLLQKPLEDMLSNENVKIPFMLSWANETWARTWDGKEKEILIKQVYSGKEDWENHIQYLLQYFKDRRYIKIDNKPVFLLYTASKIDECDKMISYWNDRLVEEGFNGIYIIETLNYIQNEPVLEHSEGSMIFEPNYSFANELKNSSICKKIYNYISNYIFKLNVKKYEAVDVYNAITKREYPKWKNVNPSIITGWDNTPRKHNRGSVVINTTPELFQKSFYKLLKGSYNGPFIFINAWNEWAEGAHLEPDTSTGFKNLEAIFNAKWDASRDEKSCC